MDYNRACMGDWTGVRLTRIASWGDWGSWVEWDSWGDWQVASCQANTHMIDLEAVVWMSLYKLSLVVGLSTQRVGWQVVHVSWAQRCVHVVLCNFIVQKSYVVEMRA